MWARPSTFWSSTAARRCAWREATTPIQFPGERNELRYIPLGVGAVIPPWNFPFAIMAGMTAAAIVTGNTVILKPSSDSPTIAAKFFEVLEEAGMPAGVVNFCPGIGRDFRQRDRGASEDAVHRVHRIEARWGWISMSARQRRSRGRSGSSAPILEMGGKDSILVGADCDLDAAVEGVVAAAFGFSGQKCSACSRAIVEDPFTTSFVERVREKVAKHQGRRSCEQLRTWDRW